MRWKSVALAAALAPAAVGCNIYRNAARNLVNEPAVACTQLGIEHDLRKQARSAWREVRAEYPRRAFSAEFRDGFIDGYVDYLDRGGNGSLPAVPPAKYTRDKKYFTENGQCLLKDYFLGFRYGQEIAIATGKRQFLTVPVLLPLVPDGPPAFTLRPHGIPAPWCPVPPGPDAIPAQPIPVPGSVRAPTPAAPKALPKSGADVPLASKSEPPAPSPPVPLPAAPAPAVKLPPPPADVPTLPDHVPTPSVLDELPVVAPYHGEVPVIAPYRGEVPVIAPYRPEGTEK